MFKLSATIIRITTVACLVMSTFAMATDDPYSKIINATQNGQYPEALSQVSQLLSQNQHDIQALLLKGNINKLMGNTDKAVAIFKGLMSEHPQMPEAYNNLAVLYADQGKPELAIETLQQVFATQSSYATAYKNLRTLYNQMASSAYRDALDIAQQPKQKNSQFTMLNTLQMADTGLEMVAKADLVQPIAVQVQGVSVPDEAGSQGKDSDTTTAITTMLNQWSKAWSDRQIKSYFSHYHQDFVPPKQLSRKRWESDRGERLSTLTDINIDLIGIKVKLHSATTATALFEQHYRSNTRSDTIMKQLTLKKYKGKWLIVTEESL